MFDEIRVIRASEKYERMAGRDWHNSCKINDGGVYLIRVQDGYIHQPYSGTSFLSTGGIVHAMMHLYGTRCWSVSAGAHARAGGGRAGQSW
jgi:hypothetical protein